MITAKIKLTDENQPIADKTVTIKTPLIPENSDIILITDSAGECFSPVPSDTEIVIEFNSED